MGRQYVLHNSLKASRAATLSIPESAHESTTLQRVVLNCPNGGLIGPFLRLVFHGGAVPYFTKEFSCLEKFQELRRGFPGLDTEGETFKRRKSHQRRRSQ